MRQRTGRAKKDWMRWPWFMAAFGVWLCAVPMQVNANDIDAMTAEGMPPLVEQLAPPQAVDVGDLAAPPVAAIGIEQGDAPLPQPWNWRLPEASVVLRWQSGFVESGFIPPAVRPYAVSAVLQGGMVPNWNDAERTAFMTHRLRMLWRMQAFAEATRLLQAVPFQQRDSQWRQWWLHTQLYKADRKEYCEEIIHPSITLSPQQQQQQGIEELACHTSTGAFGEALLRLQLLQEKGVKPPIWLQKWLLQSAGEVAAAEALPWPEQWSLEALLMLTQPIEGQNPVTIPDIAWESWLNQPEARLFLLQHPLTPVSVRVRVAEHLLREGVIPPNQLISLYQPFITVSASQSATDEWLQKKARFLQQWQQTSSGKERMVRLEAALPLYDGDNALLLALLSPELVQMADDVSYRVLTPVQQQWIMRALAYQGQWELLEEWVDDSAWEIGWSLLPSRFRDKTHQNLPMDEPGTEADALMKRQLAYYMHTHSWPEAAYALLYWLCGSQVEVRSRTSMAAPAYERLFGNAALERYQAQVLAVSATH